VADGRRMICKFNRNAGASVIGMQGILAFQGHSWEVELKFVQNEGGGIRQSFTLDFVQGSH
jgi:hypothetical protein